MKIIVFSHKKCWKSNNSTVGWATDGGFSIHMDYLSKLFDKMTILVPEISSVNKGEVSFESKNINIIPIKINLHDGFLRKIMILFWGISNCFKLLKLIRDHDCIHAPIPSDIGTIGIWYALLLKKPLYVRYCGNILNLKTPMERYWFWLLNRIAGSKNIILATGGGSEFPSAKNKNIKWIFSSSINREIISKIARKRILMAENSNKFKIGFLGRIEEGKGLRELLAGFNDLQSERFYELELKIAGDGSILSELMQCNKNVNVTFCGKLNRNEVFDFLDGINLFVFPSSSEGFPKVVLEAMATGLPIITSNVSILPELVETNNCGLILDEISSKAIVSSILDVLSDPVSYKLYSLNSIKTAQKYTMEKWIEEIDLHLKSGWCKD
jgi:glycosyltransferase involved in cell wall biosynthesis